MLLTVKQTNREHYRVTHRIVCQELMTEAAMFGMEVKDYMTSVLVVSHVQSLAACGSIHTPSVLSHTCQTVGL